MVYSAKGRQEPLCLHETKLSLLDLQRICTPNLELVLTLLNIDNVMVLIDKHKSRVTDTFHCLLKSNI